MIAESFACEGGCDRELPVEQAAVRQPGEGFTICDDCFGEYTVAEVAAAVRLAS